MSDTTDTMDNIENDWITPKEVEQEFNVKLRQVYRWVERNQVAFIKANRATKVSRAAVQRLVEQARNQEVIDSVVSQVFDGQEDTTDKTLKSGITMQLVRLQNETQELRREKDELYKQLLQNAGIIGRLEERAHRVGQMEQELTEAHAKMSELTELRRQEAVTIGQLQERIKVLEATQATLAAQESKKPPTSIDIIQKFEQEPQPPQEPKKKGFWQRLFGG